ncbi:hypothetical protein HPB50_015191 [Hyalomma asiaticum]|uniref:Uncharacterized protein n=1 Tax=Hyalomma asiaticum TaxID=266040 RepID=A0ACB7SQQ0_HYAAI|nr:hypothetical protein HPB50_015191 [Hyalomma asiaticum]
MEETGLPKRDTDALKSSSPIAGNLTSEQWLAASGRVNTHALGFYAGTAKPPVSAVRRGLQRRRPLRALHIGVPGEYQPTSAMTAPRGA